MDVDPGEAKSDAWSKPDPLDGSAQELASRALGAYGVPGQLVSAGEVAMRLGVSRGWVYAHAGELGALRLGSGQRPRLRFDPLLVDEALRSDMGSEGRQRRRRPAIRPRVSRADVELLPIGPAARVSFSRGSSRI